MQDPRCREGELTHGCEEDRRACMEALTRYPKSQEGAASGKGLFGLKRTFEMVLKKECFLGTGGGGREVQKASKKER